MKAVIMAGGRGTRIQSVSADIPKPMITVLGKPVLEYQIEALIQNGITDIVLVTGYLSEKIMEYFGDGSGLNKGLHLSYFNEDTPLGTAGALYYLRDQLQDDFLLIMGDLMLSVDFERFMDAHRLSGAAVTLFVHPNSHPYDSDIIVTDQTGSEEMFSEDKYGIGVPVSMDDMELTSPVTGVIGKKDARGEAYHNQVNAGIYAVSPEVFTGMEEPKGKLDLDKDIIRPLISAGRVRAYRSVEYVKDMGTPERYREVTEAVRTGLVSQKNLKHRQKAIFLDRDGTINVERGFLDNASGMELIPGSADAIRKINGSEYLAIVITNQPVIARGGCAFSELDRINRRLETLLGAEGAYIDDLFYCPHHTDRGFDGEVKSLKFKCRCRKPAAGMIEAAAMKYNIDLASSWMIGDKTSDIKCGMNAGTGTALLMTGSGGTDGRFKLTPDYTGRDLADAVNHILAFTPQSQA